MSMEYQTIYTIKQSEKATVELAAADMFEGPVVVKRLKGGKPEVYRLLFKERNVHIPKIYAVEEHGDELLVAEEYVDGENLGERLQRELLSDEKKLDLALQLCEAVGFLHTLKPSVIHRDIKPSNILVTGKGELKLIDFDASRQYKEKPGSGDTRLLGTVEYAPPEQFGYSQTDVRSDIYSMGVVFHEMRPTENKKLAEQWEKIAEKCTSFDPKNRYQSVTELKRELEKLAEWKKNRVKKVVAWIGGTVAFGAVVAGTIFLVLKQNLAENVDGTAPTITLSETPAPMEATPVVTLSPTPAATSAPIATPTQTEKPEPTLMPTPAATPSPTPASEPSLSPEPTNIPADTESIVAELRRQSYFIDNFYKGLDSSRDFMTYSTQYEGGAVQFSSVTLYDYVTNQTTRVPVESIYNENNVLHINNAFLQELEPSCYRMNISYVDTATGRAGSMETHLWIHEEDGPEKEAEPLVNNYLDFYYEYNSCIHTIVSNAVDSRFAEGDYRLLEDGLVMELDYDFLMQYMEPGQSGEVAFIISLENGRTGTLIVNYKRGIPSYAQ